MKTWTLLALCGLFALACKDKSEDTSSDDGGTDGTDGGTDGTDGGTDGTDGGSDGTDGGSDGSDGGSDGSDGGGDVLYTMTGNAYDFQARTPATTGLCVYGLDPTPVLSGGTPEVVSSGTVGEGGAFVLENMPVISLGTLVLVQDCDGSGSTAYPSATGVPTSRYESVEDGGVVEGVPALSLSAATATYMASELTVAGYAGDFIADGAAMGQILDAAGEPVDGATMSCGACTPYYGDSDFSDGVFATDGVANSSTSAEANALWVVPGATLTTYQPSAEGLTFNSSPLAGLPGTAVIAVFAASE